MRANKNKIPPLFKHQVKTKKFAVANERVFDTSDPGTGKTRGHLEAFSVRRAAGGGCMLVIAPKSLLRSAWEDDARRFTPHLKVSVATADNREAAFAVPADIYVTNTDAAKWLVAQKPSFFKRFTDLLIDEISSFKHRTSQRSKAMNKIKKFFKWRAGLSGTPNSNSVTDLWHPMLIIDDGRRLGKVFFHFRASVCEPQQVGPQAHMLKWVDKPHSAQAVAHLLTDISIRHVFEECLDIPENHTYSMNYYMGPAQTKAYLQMKKLGMAQFQGSAINTTNAAGIASKLLQIASGASYSGIVGRADEYVPVANERYELVADLVEQREHSVVFFNWKHQRDFLIKEFEKRGITYVVVDGSTTDKDRKLAVDHFQAGFYRVFLAHPQSAAHGLTLTRGTTTIWASPTYNLEHFLQGNRRIYRAGQTKRTETIVIIAPDTIEELVYQKLMDKNIRQLSLLEILSEQFKDMR